MLPRYIGILLIERHIKKCPSHHLDILRVAFNNILNCNTHTHMEILTKFADRYIHTIEILTNEYPYLRQQNLTLTSTVFDPSLRLILKSTSLNLLVLSSRVYLHSSSGVVVLERQLQLSLLLSVCSTKMVFLRLSCFLTTWSKNYSSEYEQH